MIVLHKLKASRYTLLLSLFLILSTLGNVTFSQRKKMDLFLLAGQSNMAGRGHLDSATIVVNSDKIYMIDSLNAWVKAKHPLHFDKPKAVGVGAGLTFAKKVLEHNSKRSIGLIPTAVGGSGIDDWQPGAKHKQTGIYAYDAMQTRTKIAQKSGRIRAVLWHQGENDSNSDKIEQYEKKLIQFFIDLRKELRLKKAPIIVATLGDFYSQNNPMAARINEIIQRLPSKVPYLYVVSSIGLTHNGDRIHFGAKAQEELGYRYAEEYLKSISK